MSAPASEDIRELERLLVVASESGETCEFGALREELAMGHADLSEALDRLREHGKAVEVAPGEWTGPDGDAPLPAGADPVRVTVVDRDDDGDEAEAPPRGVVPESQIVGYVEPTVRLTMAIAERMTPESLGELVKAGIDDAARREEPFVMEVLP